MVAHINLPRILRVGAGASRTLAATLAELSLCRPLIITDSFMIQSGYSTRLVEQLDEAGFAYGVFGECVPDPTTDSVAVHWVCCTRASTIVWSAWEGEAPWIPLRRWL